MKSAILLCVGVVSLSEYTFRLDQCMLYNMAIYNLMICVTVEDKDEEGKDSKNPNTTTSSGSAGKD